jgi:hypothetical protein
MLQRPAHLFKVYSSCSSPKNSTRLPKHIFKKITFCQGNGANKLLKFWSIIHSQKLIVAQLLIKSCAFVDIEVSLLQGCTNPGWINFVSVAPNVFAVRVLLRGVRTAVSFFLSFVRNTCIRSRALQRKLHVAARFTGHSRLAGPQHGHWLRDTFWRLEFVNFCIKVFPTAGHWSLPCRSLSSPQPPFCLFILLLLLLLLLLLAWLLHHSQTFRRTRLLRVRCVDLTWYFLHTQINVRRITVLSFLEGAKTGGYRACLSPPWLLPGSENNFLSKTDHCHRKACRDFTVKSTWLKKLLHYGIPSAIFVNWVKQNVAT